MHFKEATDALAGGVTHEELAAELGISVQRIRQARLEPGSAGYRPAPAGWEGAVARLARKRGGELEALARKFGPPGPFPRDIV
jgi:hypothetical protein